MSRRFPIYIITLGILALFFVPAFFSPETSSSIIVDRRAALNTLLSRFPLLAAVMGVSLAGTSADRKLRGWRIPGGKAVLTGFALPFVTLAAGSLFPAQTSFVVENGDVYTVVLILLGSCISAVVEEAFFRSWFISVLPRHSLPLILCIVLSSFFFAALHFWQGYQAVLFALFVSVIYSSAYIRGTPLPVLIFSHIVHNSLVIYIGYVR